MDPSTSSGTGWVDTSPEHAPEAPTGAPAAASGPPSARRRRSLTVDLTILGVIGVLLIAALGAAGVTLYREFYSPSSFVARYLDLLSDGDAADALAVPGVVVDSTDLDAAGLPLTASEALLRAAALSSLDDIRVESEEQEGDAFDVTVSYTAGGYPGTSTFRVEQSGWTGVAPAWRFALSPLAVIELSVTGSMNFRVNGFEVDKRQVSPDGLDADPAAAIPLLVFSPGTYSVDVDTQLARSPGVAVLSDVPLKRVPVEVTAEATEEFVRVVQENVDGFLAECATQQVLQPTGCPFGFVVRNRVQSTPEWSIASAPAVTVVPDGAGWRIPEADAVAHIDVDIRSLFDGSIRTVSEDVPFSLAGAITVQPDGSVSIAVTGSEKD